MAVDSDKHHTSVFYDSDDEKLRFLADYFREGLTNHEMCIYVGELTREELIDKFQIFDLNVEPYLQAGDFRVFDAIETYLGNGRFVADYMLNNVANFLEDAKNEGYNGLRTAGEMNWIGGNPEFQDEAAHYEGDVNDLASLIKFTGICLYATNKVSRPIISDALRTHSEFRYEGQTHPNPYYFVPLELSYNDGHDRKAQERQAKLAIKKLLSSASPEPA